MKNLLKILVIRGRYVFIATIVTFLICVGHEGVFYFLLLSISFSIAACFLAYNLDNDATIHFRKYKPEFSVILRIGKWCIFCLLALLLAIPTSKQVLGSIIWKTGIDTGMMFVPALIVLAASIASFVWKVERLKVKLAQIKRRILEQ